MPQVLINGGGFIGVIPCTIGSSGADKGKVTAFGTSKTLTYVGLCKPTYVSQESSSAQGDLVEITTGSGITLTAPKKVKKISLIGAESSVSSPVTDEYELNIIEDAVSNLAYFRSMERSTGYAIFLIGTGYDVSNAEAGFEAIQAKVSEISRSVAANGDNSITVKIKGIALDWKSTVVHGTLNTAVATLGTSGSVTPIGEDAINLTTPTGRLFTADDLVNLKAGVIVPKS